MHLDEGVLDTGKRISSPDETRALVDELLRRKSPFDEYVDRAAELVRGSRDLIDNAQANFSALDRLIEQLESKIFFAREAEELVFNLKHQHRRQNIALLNDAYCAWETALEQIFTARLCNETNVALQDYRLNNRFQRLLNRETSMLRNPEPKHALFIGSGPFPVSAMWLHRILGVPVDGLDISADAVGRSRTLTKRLGMDGAIRIIHETSSDYDVSAYDIIIIALLAKPKQAILENIHRSIKDNCEIVCRTSFGLRNALYEPTILTHELLNMFSIEDVRIVSGCNDDTISSLLLKKLR